MGELQSGSEFKLLILISVSLPVLAPFSRDVKEAILIEITLYIHHIRYSYSDAEAGV